MRHNIKLTLALVAIMVIGVLGYGKTQEFQCPINGGTLALTVAEGDSAWSIAERFCSGNIQNATAYIIEKYGTNIHPGQQINLP